MRDPNRAPAFACLYHGLCVVARQHGYALAIHGSVVTDLDLVAIPWTNTAVSAEELVASLKRHIGAVGYEELLREKLSTEELVQEALTKGPKPPGDPELKPHGRRAWNLYLEAGAKVDLSVMPRQLDWYDGEHWFYE